MELNLFHYTFTDVENDGQVIGGGRVEESEGGSGGNVGGDGWSGCNNVGVEGGGRTEGSWGGAGGRGRGRYKNSKSSIPTLLFLNIITCPPSKHFCYHCLQYTEKYAFLPQREMQKGENCPFSHKHKLMSLISLYI